MRVAHISIMWATRLKGSLESNYRISAPAESPEAEPLSCDLAAASIVLEGDTRML
jgi:hypothetical protein